jgi:hypothetical protein
MNFIVMSRLFLPFCEKYLWIDRFEVWSEVFCLTNSGNTCCLVSADHARGSGRCRRTVIPVGRERGRRRPPAFTPLATGWGNAIGATLINSLAP